MRKTYKIIVTLSIAIGILLLFTHFFSDKIAHATGSNSTDTSDDTVVYLSPHADDETLTFAVPILNDIRAGKKVYMVLMSDGSGSVARNVINGKFDDDSSRNAGKTIRCKWHKVYHNPTPTPHSNGVMNRTILLNQYKDGALDRKTFGLRRIDEFYVATAKLGIPRERVQINLIPNNAFTYSNVKQIIQMNVRLFPNAAFKTMSHTDGHQNHAMVGKVINDMHANGEIKSKANYLSIYTDRFYENSFASPGYKLHLTDTSDKQKVLDALYVYKKWDPKNGWYGLGYHSVPAQFDGMAQDTYTKVVRN
ncbi:PIG-L family deacetylase [Hazenella sp. IB182357]|uniref:PIG-L family deacetylase n=1 Tax=Polycladospora coralii TaxID=2771432 RepID=A0A926NA56_9BACL|nr:PIG-L family deacetylase [Polycladospora coralii]MBD1372653.1 PIG-L family deacetylase [Polycladospora coralii]